MSGTHSANTPMWLQRNLSHFSLQVTAGRELLPLLGIRPEKSPYHRLAQWIRFQTVAEMARMGGIARAKAHSKTQLREWGKEGGRPVLLDRKALAHLEALLHRGKSQAEFAAELGVSIRTIGRAVARMKKSDESGASPVPN